MNPPGQITPAMIRSGDPAALAALCQKRGAAVFAYCEEIVGEAHAGAAAADAFGRFRLAAIAPGSLTSARQAEELLRHGTRRAAMSLAAREGLADSGRCAGRQEELLAYVEDSLAPPARDAVEAHVAACRSCAAALERLEAAEPAFGTRRAPLPPPVVAEIVMALVDAAPVTAYGGDAAAVRDEALRLVSEGAGAAAPAAPALAHQPAARKARSPQPTPREAYAPATPPSASPDKQRRRPRIPRPSVDPLPPGRSAALMRGAAKFIAVVIAAGVVGTLLGIGIAALTGEDSSSPQSPAGGGTASAPPAQDARAATATRPTTTTSPAPAGAGVVATSGGELRVDVLSATARPLTDDTGERASVRVRTRIHNNTGRVVRPVEQPVLLVDGARVALAPESSGTAGDLLAPSLEAGATADGTLRFDTRSATTDDLTEAVVRLRIAGKNVTLEPEVREPAAAD